MNKSREKFELKWDEYVSGLGRLHYGLKKPDRKARLDSAMRELKTLVRLTESF